MVYAGPQREAKDFVRALLLLASARAVEFTGSVCPDLAGDPVRRAAIRRVRRRVRW
jgi:hypothetical protein